jgi:hypothetical protein
MSRAQNRLILFLPLLAAAYWLAYMAFGARVPNAEGLGWDGQFYAAFARDFPGRIAAFGVPD